VASALNRLAAEAGDRDVMSWDARLDPIKEELRRPLSPDERGVFDLFAPPTPVEPSRREACEMAAGLAAAGPQVDPGVDPTAALREVDRPVHLVHGRRDHLIPYTEGVRLSRALPREVLVRSTVTGLFGHSTQDPSPGPVEGARERAVFLQALAGILALL
jgi:pimeloyl-ACP methyl ester carboxylesterase